MQGRANPDPDQDAFVVFENAKEVYAHHWLEFSDSLHFSMVPSPSFPFCSAFVGIEVF